MIDYDSLRVGDRVRWRGAPGTVVFVWGDRHVSTSVGAVRLDEPDLEHGHACGGLLKPRLGLYLFRGHESDWELETPTTLRDRVNALWDGALTS